MITIRLNHIRFSLRTLLFGTVLFLCSQTVFSEKVYLESSGVVLMEAENTESGLGLWVKSTTFAGYSGSGHLEFTGNVPDGSGSPNSPLKFKFKITTEGDYALVIRGRSRLLSGEASDVCNDAWVRLEGDFSIGAGGPPAMSWLTQDTKMFVGRGGNGDWGWGSKFDINHVQPSAIYHFKAGETYTLTVSGRSQRFNLDRILFVNALNNQTTEKAVTTESATFNDGSVVERYEYEAMNHFENTNAGVVPFYKDAARQVLAIDASVVSNRDKFAKASTSFTGKNGKYDVTLSTMAEFDGECTYKFSVNGFVVGTYQNTRVTEANDYQVQKVVFKAIAINKNDIIAVEANTHTNLLIPEGTGTAWARGRWQKVSLTPALFQGRVAVVADGNYRDADDIAGTPVSLAILRSLGLEKKLVHYSHSCDLVPGASDPGGEFREVEMQTSSDGTAMRWGGLEHIKFFNCMKEKAATIDDLKTQINTSSETDPLWIIEAGEPDIMWEAVNKSDVTKRQFIHIVSHHVANDAGDTHDLSDVMALGIPSVNLHYIPDQNALLKKPLADWYWARDHSDAHINWLWERGFTAQTAIMNYPAIVGFFDCSDAGMLYYWGTINNGGDMACDVPKLQKLFNDFIALNSAKAYFVKPVLGDVIEPRTDLKVEAGLTVPANEIASIELFVNNVSVRKLTAAPFQWGFDAATDAALKNIAPGTYNLKLVVTDTNAAVGEALLTVKSPEYASFITPKNAAIIETGTNLTVEAGLNIAPSKVENVQLFLNNVLVRSITAAPFTWGTDTQIDVALANLAAGAYTLKLLVTDKNANTSVTTLAITVKAIVVQGPYKGAPIAIPGVFEAEDYDKGEQGQSYHDTTVGNLYNNYNRTDGVDIGAITATGGYCIGSTEKGEWVEYTINVAEAGLYDFDFLYSSGSTTLATIGASLEDVNTSLFTGFTLAKTTNWTTYISTTKSDVQLPAGIHVLRFTVQERALNIDRFEVRKKGNTALENGPASLKINAFPNPSTTGVFNLNQLENWEVYSSLGQKILVGTTSTINLSAFNKGMYLLKTKGGFDKLMSN